MSLLYDIAGVAVRSVGARDCAAPCAFPRRESALIIAAAGRDAPHVRCTRSLLAAGATDGAPSGPCVCGGVPRSNGADGAAVATEALVQSDACVLWCGCCCGA